MLIILKEKNKLEEQMLSDIKTHSKVVIIKTLWYWQKDKLISETKNRAQKRPSYILSMITDKESKQK